MKNTEIRLTPHAIELLEELDKKGLAYEARELWPEFVEQLPDDVADEIADVVDNLQCELVYEVVYEDGEAISIADLPWSTLAAMKKAHQPEPKSFETKAETDHITGVRNVEERSGTLKLEAGQVESSEIARLRELKREAAENLSKEVELQLAKDNVANCLADGEDLQKLIQSIQTALLEKNRSLSLRNFAQNLTSQLAVLMKASQEFIDSKSPTVDEGKSLCDRWRLLSGEARGVQNDLHDSERLLKPVELEFPFPEPREGQLEAAQQTRDALISGDVATCAPTGFGKSAFVLSAASGFSAGAYVITPQRVLVKQYEDDFKEVPWVGFFKSRASFKCRCEKARAKRKGPPEDWPTCADFADACGLGVEDKGKGTCPYAVARDEALSKPVVVMTAAMATTMMLYQSQRFPKRSVLAVDECQRFEDTLMSACTTTIKRDQLVKDQWTMENPLERDGELLLWPKDVLNEHEVKEWLKEWVRRVAQRLDTMKPSDLEGAELKQYRRYDSLRSSLKMAFMFESSTRPTDQQRPHAWLHKQEDQRFNVPESFEVKPLSAVGMLDDIMGDAAARKLLVSATPGTPEYIQDTLGLTYKPQYLGYGSPFPIENRPVIFNPVVRLNYQSSSNDYKKLTDMIVRIVTDTSDDKWTDHANQKGIIHTVSNKLHKIVIDALRRAKQGHRIREVKGSYRRLEIMDEFMESDEPLIMVGPAITDGVSLSGAQGRWGIICKLPWPPPVDPAVAYRKDNIPDWYAFQVVLSVIQACGRIVRGKDDWGVNYVLDSGFESLIARNRHLFPAWFLDAVIRL